MPSKNTLALLCGSALASLAAGADAQQQNVAPSNDSISQRALLTGSWDGLRTRLADAGYTVTGSEVVDSVHNYTGGDREMSRAAGQFLFGLTIDTDKAWGHPGGKVQLTVTNRHGRNLSNDANLGLLQPMQSIYGRGEIWRLADFWYEQTFNDGATALKVGRVTHGEDFGATPCGNVSNVVLCGPASSQIVSGYLYNLPVSSWGMRLRQRLATNLHLNVGVIESNPVNLREDRGFYLGTGGATGTIYATELQWTPSLGAAGNLPGTYKIGAWYDTSNSDNVAYDIHGDYTLLSGLPAARENHHVGFHGNVVQQLVAPRADGSHGLNVVANLAVTDRASNKLRSKMAMILSYTGPIPGRPRDDVTFGIGQVTVNNHVTRAQRAQQDAGLRLLDPQKNEVAAELNYGFRITPAATIRPGLQFVRNPGGQRDRGDILAASLKLVLAL
jgi:porin